VATQPSDVLWCAVLSCFVLYESAVAVGSSAPFENMFVVYAEAWRDREAVTDSAV